MANINIDAFIHNVQDVARQYLFMLTLQAPTGLMGGSEQYLVQSSTVPPQTIDPIELNWQGNIVKYGSTHTWDDWTVTFKVDANAEIHRVMSNWQNLSVHNPETNWHGAPLDYMRHQRVRMLNGTTGGTIREFQIKYAWPQSVGEITLDHGAKETATFDVTFTYQYAVPLI